MDTTGRIGLVSGGTDWASRLIVKVTGSPIHHAFIDCGDGTCVSAQPDGVKRMKVSDFPDVLWVEVGTLEQRQAAAKFALTLVNEPYNVPAFILAGLNSMGLVPFAVQPPLAIAVRPFGYICSQLVDAAFYAAGLGLFPGPSAFVWPGELARLVPEPV